jgi:hypothetical protein
LKITKAVVSFELEDQIGQFVDYYKNHRYSEALNNLAPSDVYFGKSREILTRRVNIKKATMLRRKRYNCALMVASTTGKRYLEPITFLIFIPDLSKTF